MTQQAELLKTIDTLSPKYLGEVIDFAAYLRQKEQKEAAHAKRPRMTAEEEAEYIKRNAEWLNEEAEDVLLDQDLDAFEEDLKQATPEMLALLRDTTVTFNMADCVAERLVKESSSA